MPTSSKQICAYEVPTAFAGFSGNDRCFRLRSGRAYDKISQIGFIYSLSGLCNPQKGFNNPPKGLSNPQTGLNNSLEGLLFPTRG